MSRATPRSVIIAGRHTSVSVEDEFWSGLREIARERGQTLQSLLGQLASRSKTTSLSAEIRLFVFRHFRKAVRANKGERA